MSTSHLGRPAATTHAAIERAAFGLFAAHGFEATTLDMIAEEIGVSRRTVTRYYPSKNDIPWGQFDRTLDQFRALLRATEAEAPLWQRVHQAVVEFNDFPATAEPPHRERMRMILRTPALQAHAVLRYGQWRAVIAEFVAEQDDSEVTALRPQLVGQVSLALAMTAYEQWLDSPAPNPSNPGNPSEDRQALLDTLAQTMADLRTFLT